jgi:hypothetical protein
MKKIALLAIACLLIPGIAAAQCSKEGDPGFYGDVFGGIVVEDVFAGATYTYGFAPINWGPYGGSSCTEMDTFCIHAWDTQGWTIAGTEADGHVLDECWEMNPGSYNPTWEISITVPCEVSICDYDTFYVMMAYCDTNEVCAPECGDCPDGDPSNYGGTDYYNSDTLILHVVESPPALFIMQDSLFTIEQGQTAAYIPFGICNGDPCADPTSYNYHIVSKGHIGAAIDVSDVVSNVPGGECEDVYGVIDAGSAIVCDLDTLTIIAWDLGGTIYDTCVQIIHVVEPIPVPLFSTPVITILVLAMILSAAVFMRRRAANRA